MPERKKVSFFPLKGLKHTELARCDHWETTLWITSSQHSSKGESQALEMINPAGKGWWIHLLIFNHTATQFKGAGWVLPRAVLAPSLSSWPCPEPCKSENPGWEWAGGAQTQGQDRQGTKPTDFISISQFPSAFYPTGHIGQGHFPCSYLRETSISLRLVLF